MVLIGCMGLGGNHQLVFVSGLPDTPNVNRTKSDMEIKQRPPTDTKIPDMKFIQGFRHGVLTPREEHSLGSDAAYPLPW